MATQSFRSLAAYELAASPCDDPVDEIEEWPSFEEWSPGVRLARAAGSVGDDIAEAAGRWTHGGKRPMLVIARGPLYEAGHWVERATKRGLLTRLYEARIDEIHGASHGLMKRPVN